MSEEAFHIDPVSQFVIHKLVPFQLGGFDLSYTNSALFMSIGLFLTVGFFMLASRGRDLLPSRLQVSGEMAYSYIANMVRENAGPEAMPYFPMVFSLFFFVLIGNLLGMVPGAFTYTSHIVVTFALAISLFLVITALGFIKHGHHFLGKFLPPGVPLLMAPMIFILELISYLVRPFTLAVRLFANMLAGHMVLKVFAYFALGLIGSGSLGLMAFGLIPVAMNVALIALELFVAVLQAVIFAILTCVYLRDALVIEH